MFFTERYFPQKNALSKANSVLNNSSKAVQEKKRKLFDNVPLVFLFLLGLFFLFIRAKYGFCFNDEPFCVTLGQRLYNGDALIAEEWHGCQFFSAVMLPFYAVFRLFSQTNEGILLFLRYSYSILWWICCIYVAVSVVKRPVGISLVFCFLLFFSPLDYMTISYTSMGTISALVISCVMYRIPTDAVYHNVSAAVAFSLFWAILVLCSPFMVVAYIVILVMAITGAIFEKKHGTIAYFQNLLSMFRYALIIDGTLAVLYIVCFILSRAELFTIINSIPYIFSDPEHQSNGIVQSVLALLYSVFEQGPEYLLVAFFTFLYALITRPYRIRLPLFALNAVLYLYSQFIATITPYHFNVQMLHIIFLGAVAFSLLRNKNYKQFLCFYGFSVGFALLNGLASNTGILSVSMATTVAGCAAIVFIIQLANELLEQYKQSKPLRMISVVLVCGILCVQLSSEFFIKLTRQYWDSPPYQLTETISCGAAKGLKTTPDMAHDYTSGYHALTYLLDQIDTTDKRFLSCTSAPYVYLDADLEFATFSAWSFGYDSGLNDRILSYQQVNPENTADIIYCASQEDILPFIDELYTQYEFNGHYLFVRNE